MKNMQSLNVVNPKFCDQNATSGTYKILGDQLRNDPKLLVTDTLQMIENVLSHDCVYPGVGNV